MKNEKAVPLDEVHAAIDAAVEALQPRILEVRRYLHAHPEPSGEEFRTTAYLQDQLENEGVEFRVLPSGRGLVTDRARHLADGCFALRADIDALRLQDEKSAAYRSEANNLMHACGHDAHAAMALGAVLALHAVDKLLPAAFHWRGLFQPAEETARGALEMIQANALENVTALAALHVDPTYPAGVVAHRPGALTASVDEFTVTIDGIGGHGARPHTTRDPLAAACAYVNLVYQQVPRWHDARQPVVVSFGVIQGGVNPNVIPETVQLRGTIRTVESGAYLAVIDDLHRLAKSIEQACEVRFGFIFDDHLGPVVNDPILNEIGRQVAFDICGASSVQQIPLPSMGGEDFAYYLDHVRGLMLRLGTGFSDRPSAHLHSPRFDIDEAALPIGARLLARTLLAFHASLPENPP